MAQNLSSKLMRDMTELTGFAGVRQRSRLLEIIKEAVTGERLLRAGWGPFLGSYDGINNAFNTLEHAQVQSGACEWESRWQEIFQSGCFELSHCQFY